MLAAFKTWGKRRDHANGVVDLFPLGVMLAAPNPCGPCVAGTAITAVTAREGLTTAHIMVNRGRVVP